MNPTTVIDSDHEVETPLRTVRYDRDVSTDEKTWAADNLADMPIKLIPDEEGRHAYNWVTDDGKTFRKVGSIVASPFSQRRFRINWFEGATDEDIVWLQNIVKSARMGMFGEQWGWDEFLNGPGGDTCWFYSYSRQIDPDEDFAVCGDRVVRCTEPACDEFDGGFHLKDETDSSWEAGHTHEVFTREEWEIELYREDSDDWSINIDHRLLRSLTASEAAALASDIHWAVAECNRLNQAPVAS